MISVLKHPVYSKFSSNMQQEVFEFGSNAALNSGLFDTLSEAQKFANEIITEAFEATPDRQYCFAILSDNNTVGCAWLRDTRCQESPTEIRLSYIRIDPGYRHKGLARKSMQLIEEYVVKEGFTEVSLNVFANLPHAKKLYEQAGFAVVHETERDSKVVTTEMRKVLTTFHL